MQTKLKNNWQKILSLVESFQGINSLISEGLKPTVSIFGAGAQGQEALQYFQKKNFQIQCFIDNLRQKQGTELRGIPIVSVDHPLVKSASVIIIASKISVGEISQQLRDQPVKCISFDSYFVLDNLKRYEGVRNEILKDETSIRSLDGIILSMLTNSKKYCAEIMDWDQYFCLPHFLSTDDFFVDAGAYVGDSVERFIWANTGMFRHIFLFEPGKKQIEALKIRMNRLILEWALDPLKISIINAGLSDQGGEWAFEVNHEKPAGSAFRADEPRTAASLQTIPMLSLDSYFEKNHSPVTFIKSDIEGMETSMLRGAKNLICKYRPRLALSTYHKPGDLFEIINFVKGLVPHYQFALRHHSPNLSETVLYCWEDSNL